MTAERRKVLDLLRFFGKVREGPKHGANEYEQWDAKYLAAAAAG
jgi:hypothetical protein